MPKIVLGELIPPIPVIPVGTNAHGEVTEVTWAVSLPPSKRRPALHHAVDLAIALPLPRDSPVLRVTTDRLLTIASWCGKHESSSCIRMCLHSSQQLLVVLHTAQCIRSVAAVTMPSPAAKLKAARRLPKRLRLSGEEPQGDIARMREEATARYERGESSSSTLHSCLQRPRTARTDGNPDWRAGNTWSWNAGWDSTWHSAVEWRNSTQDMGMAPYEQETEASSWYWTSSRTLEAAREKSPNRPLPPRPPSPRRQRPEQVWKARAGEVDKTTADTIPRATSPALGVVKSRPQSSRNRNRGNPRKSPAPDGSGGTAAAPAAEVTLGRLEAQDATGPAKDHEVATPDQEGKRSSAPSSDSEELVPVEPDREMGTAQEGKRCPAPNSDSEELVPVAPDQEMGTGQEGKRCPAPDSGSEELVPAAPNQDVRTRPGEAKASNSPGLGASASHTPASAASQPRPWTRKDTDLSKALSRVLRHRSNLQLGEAGYAKLADVLFHPLIRDLNPVHHGLDSVHCQGQRQATLFVERGWNSHPGRSRTQHPSGLLQAA